MVVKTARSPVPKNRAIWVAVGLYAGVAAASTIAAVTSLGLWGWDMRIPITYHGDALGSLAGVKTMIETGWTLHNPVLGFPGTQSMVPFPTTELLQLVILRLMTLFSHSAPLVVNTYYLGTYALIAVVALGVLRALAIAPAPAAFAAVLYSMLPYHVERGELHLFLAGYYLVPLAVLVALWAWTSKPPVFAPSGKDHRWHATVRDPRTIAALAICLALGLGGFYYAAFAMYFIALAASVNALCRRSWKHLVGPAILLAVIAFGLVVALSPYLASPEHRTSPSIANRSPADTLVLGLNLSDMLLPAEGYRIPAVNQIQQRYSDALIAETWQLENEGRVGSLGAIGALGFLFLVSWLPYRALARERPRLKHGEAMTRLSVFTFFGILLAMNGGFGTLISLLVNAQVRAYNRISVFVAFFALTAVALLLDAWVEKTGNRAWVWSALIVVLLLGILDQTPGSPVRVYAMADRPYTADAYRSDAEFVASIEKAVPRGSAIFQLPFIPFPESGTTNAMSDYEHYRGYLNSAALKWSYGAVRSTDAANFAEQTSKMPPKDMIAQLKQAGFAGLWLDLRGYAPGDGQKMADGLAAELGAPQAMDAQRQRLFWVLR